MVSIVRPVGGGSDFLRARGTFTAAYTGPGNLVSGATAWYGLRAYNAAYATGSNNAVDLRRSSDNATTTLVILSSGALDVASAATFAGTNATGAGSITGTTLTFTGGVVGGQVTGGTTAAGTCIVSGSSPTWTVNISQTVASATLTVTNGMLISKLYDQSGNNYHLLQATPGNQPILALNAINTSLPTMVFDGVTRSMAITTTVSQPQPWTISVVTLGRNAGGGGNGRIWMSGIGNDNSGILFFHSNTQVSVFANGGSIQDGTVSNNTYLHAVGIFNGASSNVVIDGSSNTGGGNIGTGAASTGITLGLGFGAFLAGNISEAGSWSGAFNSTQYGNMHTNVSAYWGTP